MDHHLDIGILALIVSCIVVLIPVAYVIVLPLVKPTIKKTTSIYIYAFTSGFFLILGIFGFIQTANNGVQSYTKDWTTAASYGLSVGIVGGAVAFTLLLALGLKVLVAKKLHKKSLALHLKGKHSKEPLMNIGHNHDLEIFNVNDVNPKSKIYSLVLLSSHKIPAGLAVGFLIAQYSNNPNALNLAFLITFLLHIVPEELIMYYRQIEIGVSKVKATIFSVLQTMIMLPFIFIGTYSGHAIETSNLKLLIYFIDAMIGSIFIYISLIEFIPEFLHQKVNAKTWYRSMFAIILGVICAVVIFIIHDGSEGPH